MSDLTITKVRISSSLTMWDEGECSTCKKKNVTFLQGIEQTARSFDILFTLHRFNKKQYCTALREHHRWQRGIALLLLIFLKCVCRVVIAIQIHFQFRRQTSKVSKRIRDNLCVQEIDRGRIGFDVKPYKDSEKGSLKKWKNGHKPIREVKSIGADSTSRKQGKVKRLDPKRK